MNVHKNGETIIMNRLRIYVSHPIRGIKGKDVTHEDMVNNNKRVCVFADRVRQLFPEVELYVPGEHDEFVTIAYECGLMTVDQILEVDMAIIDTCDGVLFYDMERAFSEGMLEEFMYSADTLTPTAVVAGDVETYIMVSTIEVLLEDIANVKRKGCRATKTV